MRSGLLKRRVSAGNDLQESGDGMRELGIAAETREQRRESEIDMSLKTDYDERCWRCAADIEELPGFKLKAFPQLLSELGSAFGITDMAQAESVASSATVVQERLRDLMAGLRVNRPDVGQLTSARVPTNRAWTTRRAWFAFPRPAGATRR